MANQRIAFVSSGMQQPKKGNLAFKRQHYYFNYGLVGLATLLSNNNDCLVIHGHFNGPTEIAAQAARFLTDSSSSKKITFLSIPSYYALPWAREFASTLKDLLPESLVIAGGRWVVQGNIDWLHNYLSSVDSFVKGVGEDIIGRVLEAVSKKTVDL